MRLQFKIPLIVFSLAILLGAPLLLTVKETVHRILLQDVERRGTARAQEVAETSVAAFEERSEQLLLPVLQAARDHTGALYAIALSSGAEVLAHTDITEKGKWYHDRLSQEGLRASTPISQLSVWKEIPILDVAVPVWSHPRSNPAEEFILGGGSDPPGRVRVGTVRLGLPLNQVLETQVRLFQKITAIVLTTGGIGLTLLLFYMRRIVLPIHLLSKAAERIQGGDYDQDVPVLSHDEIGGLAAGFNRMRRALAETTVSKNYFSGVLDNLADPLIVTSADTIIRDVNPAALRMTGYAKEELIGKPLDVLYPAGDSPLKVRENSDHLRNSAMQNLEMHFQSKSGERIPVLVSSSVLKDLEGRIADIIVIARDMTERKRLEGILRQSDKMSAVGQLAAGVAHEINNPLGVILGFTEALVFDLKEDHPHAGPLREIERETIRCKNLVQQLLTFSRVSESDHEPLDLNKAVAGALSLVLAKARLDRIQVLPELAPGLPPIKGSLNQLQQVIINLSNNALDAIGQEGKLIVRTRTVAESGRSWVVLSVIDTGSGIPSDILPRIFEPFFTTKPIGKGTGLGLGLVHEIVQKHSGTIQVESRPGHTEFTIRFPAL